MTRFAKTVIPAALVLGLAALASPAPAETPKEVNLATPAPAPAADTPIYVYAVKFVCGYNPTNVGLSLAADVKQGEPTVKFGNYATDVNIVNPTFEQADIRKSVLLLNRDGYPIGREPNYVRANWFDSISLPPITATMDDCNRIAELMFGNPVPTPMPLLIGFLVLESKIELDVTAVYTAQACSNWINSPLQLDCLRPAGATGTPYGVSSAINVEQITPKLRF